MNFTPSWLTAGYRPRGVRRLVLVVIGDDLDLVLLAANVESAGRVRVRAAAAFAALAAALPQGAPPPVSGEISAYLQGLRANGASQHPDSDGNYCSRFPNGHSDPPQNVAFY